MDYFEVLEKRRSVRRFTGDPVSPEDIEKILQSVLLAPSAGNLQSYHVYVVLNPEKKNALAEAAFGQSFVAEAPVVFVVCADTERAASRYGERGRTLYALNDSDIASTYILLTATALGYGSCWVGAFDDRAVASVLGIPPRHRPVAIIPVGVPAEQPPPRPRRADVFTVVE